MEEPVCSQFVGHVLYIDGKQNRAYYKALRGPNYVYLTEEAFYPVDDILLIVFV